MTTRIALITGANKGLGLETATQLAQQGFTVLISARDLTKANAASEQLIKQGYKAISLELDVNNSTHHLKVAEYINTTFGYLDVLVNNAGVIMSDYEPLALENSVETLPIDALKQTFETNFFGVVALTQQLLPLLKKAPKARIVNVSSILGSLALHAKEGSPIYDMKPFAYNASKTALNQFTVHLAAALRHTPIKVNSAHPGWVKTDLGGEGALMELVDGAKTIVDLCLLPDNGETGTYVHLGNPLPW